MRSWVSARSSMRVGVSESELSAPGKLLLVEQLLRQDRHYRLRHLASSAREESLYPDTDRCTTDVLHCHLVDTGPIPHGFELLQSPPYRFHLVLCLPAHRLLFWPQGRLQLELPLLGIERHGRRRLSRKDPEREPVLETEAPEVTVPGQPAGLPLVHPGVSQLSRDQEIHLPFRDDHQRPLFCFIPDHTLDRKPEPLYDLDQFQLSVLLMI